MRKAFDIFWFGENGPSWISAVETLEMAQAQIAKLPESSSGSYAVIDSRTGNRLTFAPKLQPSRIRSKAADNE
jgi:hypothetical protein